MSLSPKTYEEALEKARLRPVKPRTPLKASSRLKTSPAKRGTAKKGFQGVRKTLNPMRSRPDPKMAAVNQEVRERDGNLCQWPTGCRTGDTRIDVHHKAERSQRPDLKYDKANLVCLCRTHHDWIPLNRTEAIKLGLLNTETYELAQKTTR